MLLSLEVAVPLALRMSLCACSLGAHGDEELDVQTPSTAARLYVVGGLLQDDFNWWLESRFTTGLCSESLADPACG